MRVTIIPEDKRIIVDKRTVDLDDNDIRWKFDDSHIHAIQWRDGRGELEYEDVIGEKPVPNKIFGDDEFDTIVQPYLDFYSEFLTAFEQKQLEEALNEEERISAEQEELIADRLEKEAQIATIEDLQRQNKEVRERNEQLNDEIASVLEQNNFERRTSEIEQRRKQLEYEEDISATKVMKVEEYIQKINKDMQKKFDDLLEQFEKEKEAFIEERKMYNELLQKERDQVHAEYDAIQAQIKREDEEREEARRVAEAWEELEKESIQQTRLEMEVQTRNLEATVEEMDFDLAEIRKERETTMARLELEREEFEIDRQNKLKEIAAEKEKLEEHLIAEELDKDLKDELDFMLPDNLEIFEEEYRQIQQQKIEESVTRTDSIEQSVEDVDSYIQSRTSNTADVSINEVVQMMTDIDPEQLYTTLTDDEREENRFPVDKAVQWFAALKEVLDREN